jgi:membrane protease YdiL (CAAX protease family)
MRLDELTMDWKVVTTVVVVTLAMTVDHYHRFLPLKSYDRMALYLGLPLLVILLVFRESPARYGFRLGDWRAGLILTVVGCAGMTLVIWIVARTGAMQRYYAPRADTAIPMPLDTALDLFGWEFLFRGFLLFSLYPICGPYALVLQAVPFTIAHFGKPEIETLSCIFGGTAFGYVAWRTGSFLYPFLIHWFIASLTLLVAAGAAG